MVKKQILDPKRLRRVPRQFSWVDQRLVREDRIRGISHEALALYLFLVVVADAQGLSYYSDRATGRLLNMQATELARARRELCQAGLIAYGEPFYQVLSLEQDCCDAVAPVSRPKSCAGTGQEITIGEIMQRITGGL